LTYPFVLSWSFIEAMASGCLIVGSRTPPVLEVLRDGVNGLSVDFFSHQGLAELILSVLERPSATQALRAAARASAVRYYDLNRVLLPRWEALMQDLIHDRRSACLAGATEPEPVRQGATTLSYQALPRRRKRAAGKS
jgi:glycosyltransferase involved in cell wall biosynthesis